MDREGTFSVILHDDVMFWECVKSGLFKKRSFLSGKLARYTADELISVIHAMKKDTYSSAKDMFERMCGKGYFVVSDHLTERYSLRMDEDPLCLNRHCYFQGPDADPLQVCERLRRLLLELHSTFISDVGVDYEMMRTSKLYFEYRIAVTELQKTKIFEAGLSIPFYLNLYNCLVIHSQLQLDVPQTLFGRLRFFGKVSYQVGGFKFSMFDIENGILRGNRPSPGSLRSSYFKKSRRRLCVSLDPRIHFTLNCGAKSCPPIRVFAENNLEQALQLASEGFLRENVKYDGDSLLIPQIFSWYRRDFPEGDVALISWICKFLEPSHPLCTADHAKVKIVFAKYDWSTNFDDSKNLEIATLILATENFSVLFNLFELQSDAIMDDFTEAAVELLSISNNLLLFLQFAFELEITRTVDTNTLFRERGVFLHIFCRLVKSDECESWLRNVVSSAFIVAKRSESPAQVASDVEFRLIRLLSEIPAPVMGILSMVSSRSQALCPDLRSSLISSLIILRWIGPALADPVIFKFLKKTPSEGVSHALRGAIRLLLLKMRNEQEDVNLDEEGRKFLLAEPTMESIFARIFVPVKVTAQLVELGRSFSLKKQLKLSLDDGTREIRAHPRESRRNSMPSFASGSQSVLHTALSKTDSARHRRTLVNSFLAHFERLKSRVSEQEFEQFLLLEQLVIGMGTGTLN